MTVMIDIPIGSKFGKWTVIAKSDNRNAKSGGVKWVCECYCGTVKELISHNLRFIAHQCKSCASKERNRKQVSSVARDLYLIKCGDYVKIGSTANLQQRIKDLQVYNPYKIEVLGYWKDFGWMEPSFHTVFDSSRIHGEWFNFSYDLINQMIYKMEGEVRAKQNKEARQIHEGSGS